MVPSLRHGGSSYDAGVHHIGPLGVEFEGIFVDLLVKGVWRILELVGKRKVVKTVTHLVTKNHQFFAGLEPFIRTAKFMDVRDETLFVVKRVHHCRQKKSLRMNALEVSVLVIPEFPHEFRSDLNDEFHELAVLHQI